MNTLRPMPLSPEEGPSTERTESPRPYWIALALILLLAFALRAYRVGDVDYWQDEVLVKIHAAQIRDTLQGTLVANHTPGPALLYWLWLKAGLGGTEGRSRLLPVMSGALAVWLTYVLGARVFGRSAGLFAALLVAISPFHFHHTRELKEYFLLPTTSILLVYLLLRAAEENKWRLWAGYTLAAAAAFYSEAFAALLLVAINLWFLLFYLTSRRKLIAWFLANVCAFALVFPLVVLMVRQTTTIIVRAPSWWVPKPSPTMAAYFMKTIAFGYSDWKPYYILATILFTALLAFGAAVALRSQPRRTTLLLLWFLFPATLAYAGSHVTNSFFLYRSMLPFAMAAYLLAGYGLSRLPGPSLKAGAALILCGLSALSLYTNYTQQFSAHHLPHRPGIHPPREYRKSAEYVLERWRENDIVVHGAAATWAPFWWYGFAAHAEDSVHGSPSNAYSEGFVASNPRTKNSEDFDTFFPRSLQTITQERKRVWFVFCDYERFWLPGNAMDCWRWLDAHYLEVDHQYFKGIELFLYEVPDALEVAYRPEVIQRRSDDGVRAELLQVTSASQSEGALAALREASGDLRELPTVAYTKVQPDPGLVFRPAEERRGRLEVSLARENPTTDSSSKYALTVANTSEEEVSFDLWTLESDALIPVASLYAEAPQDSAWHVWPMHNPNGAPEKYELPTAVATKAPGTSTVLEGNALLRRTSYSATHAPGAALVMLGPVCSPEAHRAGLTVQLGEGPPLSPDPSVVSGWGLYPLGQYAELDLSLNARRPAGRRLPIRVTVPDSPPCADCVADLAYITLHGEPLGLSPYAKPEDLSGASVSYGPLPLAQEHTLKPHESLTVEIETSYHRERIDAWVFEQGEDGKVYYVFDRSIEPNTMRLN